MSGTRRPLDIVSSYWRLVGTGVFLIAPAGIALMVIRAETSVSGVAAAAPVVAAGALAAIRAWRVRLTEVGDVVVVRNVLRTHRVPWAAITTIEVRDARLTGSSDHYAYVGFRASGGWVRSSATLTYSTVRATSICEQVCEAAHARGVTCALHPDALRARWWGSRL